MQKAVYFRSYLQERQLDSGYNMNTSFNRLGDKPLSVPMLNRFTDIFMRHWGESK